MTYLRKAIKKWKRDGLNSLLHDGFLSIENTYHRKVKIWFRYQSFRLLGYNALADPWKTIWVNPDQIKWIVSDFPSRKDRGKIQDGNWDRKTDSRIRFRDSPKYKAVKLRFDYQMSWEETGIYDHLLKRIESEGSVDGCRSKEDLIQRYNEVDKLYSDITQNGYKSQLELGQAPPDKPAIGEPAVNIGRDGRIFFGGTGGWHRVSIAKIADIESIPVQVLVRHHEWQHKREAYHEYMTNVDDSLPISIDHPDMTDINPNSS